MNQKKIQMWKESVTNTFICLMGCTVASMASTKYMRDLNWFINLSISLLVALVASMLFLVLAQIWFRKMDIISAINHSYKTSIISVLIITFTEKLIVLYLAPILFSQQVQTNNRSDINTMLFALCLGFLLSLPLNHLQVLKADKLKQS